VSTRDELLRAVEFGRYLADSADLVLAAYANGVPDEDTARDMLHGLASAAYEFRKRVARASRVVEWSHDHIGRSKDARPASEVEGDAKVSTRDELLRAVGEAVRDKCRVAKGDAYGVGNSDLDAIIARVKSEYAQREPDSASEVVSLRAEVARLKADVRAARELSAEIRVIRRARQDCGRG